MACNQSNPCDNCGCLYPSNSDCVTYKGLPITCGETTIATQGDTLTEILENLTAFVCDITPSGSDSVTVVTNVANETTASSSTTGNTTTYTVGIADAITDLLTEHTNDINTLETCVENGVLDIVSNTLDITEESTGTCGRTLRIEYSPSGVVSYDGIIYSNSTKVGATGGTGVDFTLKTSSTSIGDYDSLQGFEIGDEIRFRATGQIHGDGTTADELKFDLFDTPSGILGGGTFTGFTTAELNSSWLMEGTITILDNTALASEVLVNVKVSRNSVDNGDEGNAVRDLYLINEEISNIDLSTLAVRIRYYRNVNAAVSAQNFARQLVVEVRKNIA